MTYSPRDTVSSIEPKPQKSSSKSYGRWTMKCENQKV